MNDRLEHAPCGLIEFDDDGNVTYANATLAALLGFLPAELVGRKFESILTLANRIFHQTHFFPLLKLQGQASEIFLLLRARDGISVPVITSAIRHLRAGTATNQCAFLTVPQRRKYEDEILQARRNAEEALKNNVELQAANEAAQQHASALDRRLHQVETKNQELLHVSRILSHDLREPMRKVRLFADLVHQSAGHLLDAEATTALAKVYSESDRAIALIVSVQRFLNADSPAQPEPTHLNAVIEAAAQNVRQGFADWALEVEPLPVIEARTGAIQLLFHQLLENAVKFRSPTVPLRVRITGRTLQQNSYQATKDRYLYRDFVQVEVTDNGIGFDPKYSRYVFDLLKKVELKSEGFGVGLAICRKIMESHYGSIEARSEPGVGTTFILRLPVTQ